MNQKWLLYSLDPDLKLKQLKSDDFLEEEFDHIQTTALEQRVTEYDISCTLVGEDAHYKFASIVSRPYVMYSQWDLSLLDRKMLAIVWPRKASIYHQQVMEDFFQVLSRYDIVTISGGAPGIDTQCHQLSMQYGIPTVMVLWWWFGHYLHSTKRHELKAVRDSWGLVLSEFRLKEKPSKRSFPQRNRIVAGLAETVFLPGAARESGSLITVDFAIQMHKEVVSVPASIYQDGSSGTNEYISQQKINSIYDFEIFLERYFVRKGKDEAQGAYTWLDLTETQQCIIVSLKQHGWLGMERLSQESGLDTWELLVEMMELELQWAVWEKDVGVWDVK